MRCFLCPLFHTLNDGSLSLCIMSPTLTTLLVIYKFASLFLALEGPKWVTAVKEKKGSISLDLLHALSVI